MLGNRENRLSGFLLILYFSVQGHCFPYDFTSKFQHGKVVPPYNIENYCIHKSVHVTSDVPIGKQFTSMDKLRCRNLFKHSFLLTAFVLFMDSHISFVNKYVVSLQWRTLQGKCVCSMSTQAHKGMHIYTHNESNAILSRLIGLRNCIYIFEQFENFPLAITI